jgi:hypothetical protein
VSTENVTTETQGSQATPANSGGEAQAASQGIGQTDTQAPETNGEAQAVAPQYTPNFKFKVYDEEKEFDEMFRGLVKDAETEKKVREFHEKAFGLDYQKPKYERLKNEHSELSTKYSNIDASLKQLSTLVRENDLGAFFEAINIPKNMVFNFVKQELEKMSAPPEQRQQMDEFERIRRENMMLRQQTEHINSRYETESLQAKQLELDTTLSRPEIANFSANYDAKMGKGAFRNAVIERGLLTYHTTGQQIPVMQAVQEAMNHWSPFFQGQSNGQMEQTPTAQPQAAKPSLPNVGGRSSSPIKQGPRSIEDLHKARAQITGS